MQKVDGNGLQGSIKSLLEDDVSVISVLETRSKTVSLVDINTPSPESLNKLLLAWFFYKVIFPFFLSNGKISILITLGQHPGWAFYNDVLIL